MNSKPNYAAWDISEKDYPKHGTIEEQIIFILGYGVLAPSTHNTQPWQYTINKNIVLLRPNLTRRLTVGDPKDRGLYISLGCFIENIILAAEYFGYLVDWQLQQDGSILLEFSKSSPKLENKIYLSAIKQRFSNKLPYVPKDLTDEDQQAIKSITSPNVKSTLITGKSKSAVASLHKEAALSFATKSFASELVNWLKPNNTKDFLGMPGFVIGVSQLQSKVFPKLLKSKPALLKKTAPKDYQLLVGSSGILVLSTLKDTLDDYVHVGMNFEQLALTSAINNIAITPLQASIENESTRQKLQAIIGGKNKPQLLLRLGYNSNAILHTPRKFAKDNIEMLITEQMEKVVRTPVTHNFITVNNTKIHYVTAGNGSALVMIHGANIGWPQWYQNIDELAKHHKLYMIDLPGAGDSDKVDFHNTNFIDLCVEAVQGLIDQTSLERFDLLGSSFGGWVATTISQKNPNKVNRLVLSNSIGFTEYVPTKFKPVSLRPIANIVTKTVLKSVRSNKNLESFMRSIFYKKDLLLAPEFVDYFYVLSETSHNIQFISRLSRDFSKLYFGNTLEGIACPKLIIWGKEDSLMPYAKVQTFFESNLGKNTKLEILAKVGHMPPVEAPVKFNSLVNDFLK